MLSILFSLLSILLTIFNPAAPKAVKAPAPAQDLSAAKVRALKAYAALPMSFEANEGQAEGAVRFVARGRGYTILLQPDQAALALQSPPAPSTRFPEKLKNQLTPSTRVLRMKIEAANPEARATGLERLPGVSNYLIGNDPRQWHTHIPTYKKVEFENVRPGVNLVYYGNQGELEYDFALAAGVDPRSLALRFEGSDAVLDAQGDLVFTSADSQVTFRRPVAYQTSQSNPAQRHFVAASYVLKGRHRVGFAVPEYDPREPLVIDPYLYYSTYLGGNGGDTGNGVAVDSNGDAFVTGSTTSTNFPTHGDPATYQGQYGGDTDAFVTMLYSTGQSVVYSTYLGGNNYDVGNAIGVDSSGDVYIVGTTMSTNFPTTANVFQTAFGGNTDAFVSKLDPSGSKLLYSSFLGGSDVDYGLAMALDQYGNVFVTGYTESRNFPTVNPIQSGNNGNGDAFVAEVNTQATELVYSTYLGGSSADSGQGIAVDPGDNAYVTGFTFSTNFPTYNAYQTANAGSVDAFLTKLTAGGFSYAFSTYLGGSGDDRAWAIALDSELNIYITGTTLTACTPASTTTTLCNSNSNFPTSPGAFQTYTTKQSPGYSAGFVSKFNFIGANLLYSTLLAGSLSDAPAAIAVDGTGNAYITGHTNSSDFPTANALQASFTGGSCGKSPCPNAFVTELNPAGSAPVYSTYLGGSSGDFGNAIALYSNPTTSDVEAVVVGTTNSANFPAIALAYQGQSGNSTGLGNAFVSMISHGNLAGVALTPQKLAFGNVPENTTSAVTSMNQPATVTMVNEGTAPLQVTSVGVTGDFHETDNCVGTLPAGGGLCEINVSFTPTGLSAETDQLIIKDNAAGSPHLVTLTGTGVTGNTTVLWTPNSLAFGAYVINQTSPSQTVIMTNNGQTPLTVTNITTTGDFGETNNCPSTPFTLAIQGSCAFQVTFTPTGTGVRKGALDVTDNTPAGTSAISLVGTGNPVYSLSSPNVTQTVPIGTTTAYATINLVAPSTFTDTISLTCSGGKCSFNPAVIALNSTTLPSSSTVTLTGLSPSSTNPTIFTISAIDSTTGAQTATLSLSVFFQDFTLSASPAVETVQAGGSTIYSVTVSPINGFSQPVALGCGALPKGALCLANPASLAPNGGAVSAQLSISTTAQSTANTSSVGPPVRPRVPPPPKKFLAVWLACALFMLGILLIRDRMRFRATGRRGRLIYAKAALAMLVLAAAFWVSCDTGIYTNVIQPSTVNGTPTGNYSITIVGTFTGSTSTINGTTTQVTRTTGIDLTVQ